MPAIHLDRLEQQLNLIFSLEMPGDVFKKNFISFLDAHTNLAYQAGQDLQRKSLIPKLHLPPILIHRVQLRLISLAKNKPELALEYADQLWTIEKYETKLFSAIILGNLSETYSKKVIERLLRWGIDSSEYEIHQILFSIGTKNIRQKNQDAWLEIINNWIGSNQPNQIILATSAMRALLQEPSFINLPKLFKMITPLFVFNHRKVISALQILVEELAEKNPNETAYFLSSVLLSSTPKISSQIIRKSLKLFPQKEQKFLRDSLLNLPEEEE